MNIKFHESSLWQTEGRTHFAKLLTTFRKFANAPENEMKLYDQESS